MIESQTDSNGFTCVSIETNALVDNMDAVKSHPMIDDNTALQRMGALVRTLVSDKTYNVTDIDAEYVGHENMTYQLKVWFDSNVPMPMIDTINQDDNLMLDTIYHKDSESCIGIRYKHSF